MSHRISSNKDNVFVPGVGMLDSGEEGVISDDVYAALTAAGRFEDGLLTYIEDVAEPGEGPTLTSYGQIEALPNYPTTFPADLSGLTPEVIGAQPAGNYQPAGDYQPAGNYAAADHNHDGSYATAAQGSKADSAVQPGDLGTAASTDITAYATAAQGAKADSAVQPGDLGTAASTDATDYAAADHNHDGSYATAAQGSKADSALQPGDLPWTPTEPDWNALVARVEALETPPVE